VSGADAETFSKLNFEKRQLMVQAMLADRFKLHAHDEVLVQPVYLLALAKEGPKLAIAKPAEGSDPWRNDQADTSADHGTRRCRLAVSLRVDAGAGTNCGG
jgi:uncharacterized protein (TIGR03435 family)